MYALGKTFYIDAAHRLPDYPGKCQHLHGHRFAFEIVLRSETLDNLGMVIDFVELKRIFNHYLGHLDHSLLNDYLDNPTAEELADYSWRILDRVEWPAGVELVRVKVWESPDAWASYEPN